jgi:hypothetical protein
VADLNRYFFDTSALIPGVIEMGAGGAPAQALLTAVADGRLPRPHTAWHCCLEFYSVTTRLPRELRLSPAVATQLVQEELLGRFDVHDLPVDRRQALLQSAVRDQVGGGRIYDAHIADVARAAEASLVVTENRRHFLGLLPHGIRVLTCSELVGELGL